MIKFFRKIRQQLITENKFSKYFVYAIGEIVLVVIGILIALSINNWNTRQNNKSQEIEILNELKIEYNGKLKELNEKVNVRNAMKESGLKLLNEIQFNNYSISIDSLNYHLGITTLTPTYNSTNSVTEELINSGNLYLLSNRELRKLISEWTGELVKLIEEEEYLVKFISSNYIPYLLKSYPIKNIANPLTSLGENFTKSKNNISYVTSKSNKEVNVNELFDDLEFENLLSFLVEHSIAGNLQSEDIRSRINNILAMIEIELEKNK
jgi:hypothetical protein